MFSLSFYFVGRSKQKPPFSQMIIFLRHKGKRDTIIVSYFQDNTILTFSSTFDWNIILAQNYTFRNNKKNNDIKRLQSCCKNCLIWIEYLEIHQDKAPRATKVNKITTYTMFKMQVFFTPDMSSGKSIYHPLYHYPLFHLN